MRTAAHNLDMTSGKEAMPQQFVTLADALRILGRVGGRATAKNRTKAERSAAARKAALARWRKKP